MFITNIRMAWVVRIMTSHRWIWPLISCAFCFLSGKVLNAAVEPIFSPAAFNSPVIVTHDFESAYFGVINKWPSRFEIGKVFPALASQAASGVTPSGVVGIAQSSTIGPLRVEFDSDVFEVAMFFGNDAFNQRFDVVLNVFDNSNLFVGGTSVRSNGNDFADQFIGIRSAVPIRAAELSYPRTLAGSFDIYIDDFTVGLNVPEPVPMFPLIGMIVTIICHRHRCVIKVAYRDG